MRYRDTRSLSDLIKTVLREQPHKSTEENLVMRAWYTILPSTKDQVQRAFIKGKALYLKLQSPFLQHQLYLERNKISQELKNALKGLGGNPSTIEQIFFM